MSDGGMTGGDSGGCSDLSERLGHPWLVLMLKDCHSSLSDKASMKRDLMSEFGFSDGDIRYVSSENEYYSSLSYYLFVHERLPSGSFESVYEFKSDFLEPYECHVRITEDEFVSMTRNLFSFDPGKVKFGDIVTIQTGRYSKLHGIALRRGRTGLVDVGLRFCFGSVLESYHPNDLKVTGNVFNYIKVLK